MSSIYNLLVLQGSDFSRTLTIKESGVVRDLTNHTARAMVRETFSDSSPLATFTIAIDAVAGEIAFSLSHTVTAALVPNCKTQDVQMGFEQWGLNKLPRKAYVWDLELVYPSGAVARLLEGGVLVTAEATK